MIQVYADDALVFDSRLEKYDLNGLKVTTGLNVGGTAEIKMPAGHPAYSAFTSYKTIVNIYRDGVRLFRGRALYPADNFTRQRTITCEGELCFLRDTINRPYTYQASPRSCFVTIIGAHNKATDPEKRFLVGEVTVTDPNDYIRLESESAETTLATLNKLLERCGGYIVFTDDEDGNRVINWLESLDSRSTQSIEFGENLLNFSSTGANTTSLATGLVPYGARDSTTKKRLTIESVNGGKDYILDAEAVAVRGTILATATWDDVTEPANLLKKARAYLDDAKVFITSLELTALDLSYLDRSIDSYTVGDMVRVFSPPHGIDEDFQLTKKTEDLLNPANSKVTLGKDIQSLTGADVSGDTQSQKDIEAIRVNYSTESQQIAADVETSVLEKASTIYLPQDAAAALAEELRNADQTLLDKITAEETNRKALIDLFDDGTYVRGPKLHLGDAEHVTHIYGSDKIKFHNRALFEQHTVDFGNNQGIRMYNSDGSVYYVLRVDASDNCFVGNDYCNLYLRGKDAVYLHKTGAVVTSDRRHKNSIEELPEGYEAILDKLTPVRFKYNGSGDRYHVGFIAQDVEQALIDAGLDRDAFGGFVDVSGDGSNLGLAYDEFIGLLLQKIRKLENKIEKLEG